MELAAGELIGLAGRFHADFAEPLDVLPLVGMDRRDRPGRRIVWRQAAADHRSTGAGARAVQVVLQRPIASSSLRSAPRSRASLL